MNDDCGSVRGSVEMLKKDRSKGYANAWELILKSRKSVPPEFFCVTLPLLYVTFTDSGRSFYLVPVDVTTVKGNLRNSAGIPAENTS